MKRPYPWMVLAALALVVLACSPAEAQTYTLRDLGSLSKAADGYYETYAADINASNQVAGSSILFDAAGSFRGRGAFLYTNGLMQDLGTLSAHPDGYRQDEARALNDSGQVVGASDVINRQGFSKGFHAFLYANGQMTDLGSLSTRSDGYSYSLAYGINASGQIIGWYEAYDAQDHYIGRRGFLYSDGQMRDLGNLGAAPDGLSFTTPNDINDSGQVVGQSSTYDAQGNYKGDHAFLYSDGQMKDLGSLSTASDGYSTSYALAININGQIAGGFGVFDAQGNFTGTHAFLYSDGQMKDLGALGTGFFNGVDGYSYSAARAINSSGQVVGSSSIFDAEGTYKGDHGFLYSDGQMKDMGSLGTGLTINSYSPARAINASGQVVGSSNVFDAQGNFRGTHAFLYSDGRMQDLGFLGSAPANVYLFSEPRAISDSGHVIGGSSVYDAQGNYKGQHSFIVDTAYRFSWSGVLEPINADGSSVFKRGSTVSIRFELTGSDAGNTDLAARLSYAKVSDGVPGLVNEADSSAAATVGNLFRLAGDQYLFNWSTKGLTAGTYRLYIDLGDGGFRTIDLGLN